MAGREGGLSGRIGANRSPGDPNDRRRRLGPTPKGPAAPGMPGFRDALSAIDASVPRIGQSGNPTRWPLWLKEQMLRDRLAELAPVAGAIASDVASRQSTGDAYRRTKERLRQIEAFKRASSGEQLDLPGVLPSAGQIGVALGSADPQALSRGVGRGWRSLPLGERPTPERVFGGSGEIGYRGSVQPTIPGLKLPASILSGPIATPAPAGRNWTPENRDLLALFDGAENVVLREPMTRGSFKEGTARPGEVRRVLTDYDFLASPPGSRDVYASLFGDKSSEFGAPRQEYSDGTPVEQFIVNLRTGLPDNTPIFKRNKAKLRDEEAVIANSNSREPESAVPVLFHEGGRNFSVRYVDPTKIVGQEEIPAEERNSAYDSDSFREITLGGAVQKAMHEAKTPLIMGSALNQAQGKGRFAPLRQPQGNLTGYILDQGVATPGQARMRYADEIPVDDLRGMGVEPEKGIWTPVYNPGIQVERLVPINDLPYEQRRNAERRVGDVTPIQENVYRVGSPMNRSSDALREGLRSALDAIGVGVSRRVAVPWKLEARNKGLSPLSRLLAGYDSGFQVAPLGAGGSPITREELPNLVSGMRGQEDHPLASGLRLLRDGDTVRHLVAERDLGGRLTGRFYIGEEQEVGPAALLSDPLLRMEAEKYAKKIGLKEAASLEALASALGRGGAFAPTFVPTAPVKADPITAMVARSILTDEEFSRVPGVRERLDALMGAAGDRPAPLRPLEPVNAASGTPVVMVPDYVATAGSAAKDVLEQSIFDVTQGAVPLKDLRQRLLYQAARQRDGSRPSAPEDLLPPREVRRRAKAHAMAEAARRLEEDHADLPSATRSAALRQELADALFSETMQLGFPRSDPDSELTWSAADLSRLTPSPEIDALEAYMARKARQMPPVVRTREVADQLQLDLDPRVEQLALPAEFIPEVRGWTPSPPVHRALSYLADTPSGAAGAFRRAQVDQLGLPLKSGQYAVPISGVQRSFEPPEVRGLPSAELLIGRRVGPYAGREYYGLGGNASRYQQPMTIAGSLGGFDYGQMAEALGQVWPGPVVPPEGSEQHRIAMAQLAKRIQARNAAQSAARPAPGATAFQPSIYRGYGT